MELQARARGPEARRERRSLRGRLWAARLAAASAGRSSGPPRQRRRLIPAQCGHPAGNHLRYFLWPRCLRFLPEPGLGLFGSQVQPTAVPAGKVASCYTAFPSPHGRGCAAPSCADARSLASHAKMAVPGYVVSCLSVSTVSLGRTLGAMQRAAWLASGVPPVLAWAALCARLGSQLSVIARDSVASAASQKGCIFPRALAGGLVRMTVS